MATRTRQSGRITTTGATSHRPRVGGALPLPSPRSPRSERRARARSALGRRGALLSVAKMARVAGSDSDPVCSRRQQRFVQPFSAHIRPARGSGWGWGGVSRRRGASGGCQGPRSPRLRGRSALCRAALLRNLPLPKPRCPLPRALRIRNGSGACCGSSAAHGRGHLGGGVAPWAPYASQAQGSESRGQAQLREVSRRRAWEQAAGPLPRAD